MQPIRLLIAGLALAAVCSASAQPYPYRPLKLEEVWDFEKRYAEKP